MQPRSKISDYERGTNFAKQLWGEPLASLMTEHLGDVRTLEKSAPEIVLASTLPLDSVHSAMFKMLKKRAATEGPQPLETAGWTTKYCRIPDCWSFKIVAAFKIAIKGPAAPGATQMRPIFSPQPAGTDATGGIGRMQQGRSGAEKRTDRIGLDDDHVEDGGLCGVTRLEAASQAQKKAIRRGQKVIESGSYQLDEFEMPPGCQNHRGISAQLAGEGPEADMGKVKPATLKIQYFRLELSGMLKKTMNNYKRLAKGGDLHEMPDGLWLDLLKTVHKPNTNRSLTFLSPSADKQPVD